MKRLITIITATTMIFTAVPVVALADEANSDVMINTLQEEISDLTEDEDIAPAGELSVITPEDTEPETLSEMTGDEAVSPEADTTENLKGFRYISIPGHEVPFVNQSADTFRAASTLSYYNPVGQGKLPVIRQQRGGTCWAHATIGAIEADLIHDGKAGTDIDLSEMHLAYYTFNAYEDPKHCRTDTVTHTGSDSYLDNGGSPEYATKLLSNMVGAIPEKDAPMSSDPNSFKPDTSYVVSKDTAQVRNVYYINRNDKEAIKTAVLDHGGVTLGYADDDSFYNGNSSCNAYYCSLPLPPNHSVLIVGWDDGFSRSKFNEKPAGDGAWLVRNSWGYNGYDHFGYFWISYYDKSYLEADVPMVAIDADTDVFRHCYAYDGYVLPSFFGEFDIYADDKVAVTYDVSAHEAVKAVGVEIETANATVTATAKNLSTGQSVTGNIKTGPAGIYTIAFPKPLEVYDKATVEVSISAVSSDGKPVGLACENKMQFPYGSFVYTANVDRGFIYNGKNNANCDLRVKLYTNDSSASKINVTGVSLDRTSAKLSKGSSVVLNATVSPENATVKTLAWSSSNEKVAKVSQDGKVTAVGGGDATITVKTFDQGKTATCKVTVKVVAVTGVKLNKSKATIKTGKTLKLKATVKPDDASNKSVTWSSGKKSVASVDKNGVVTGKKAGEATITVTTKDGKKKASCRVTVKDVKVKSVKLDRKSASVKVGKTIKLKATVKPTDATNKAVTWKSSNKKIASVSSKGKVTGKKKGKVTITVTTKDGKKTATCKVRVK